MEKTVDKKITTTGGTTEKTTDHSVVGAVKSFDPG